MGTGCAVVEGPDVLGMPRSNVSTTERIVNAVMDIGLYLRPVFPLFSPDIYTFPGLFLQTVIRYFCLTGVYQRLSFET